MLPSLARMLTACISCGHGCGVNRVAGARGTCRTTGNFRNAEVSSHTLHFGEEPPLVGKGGSGTVFFSRCNLACVYCQNHQISHEGAGSIVDPDMLAERYHDLAVKGAVNINLVSPTHYLYPLLEAVAIASERGMNLPLVYNTNGYDSVPVLRLLDGIIDIYLPDAKYSTDALAKKYSGAENYVSANRAAIREMYRQTGALEVHEGVARHGTIIRHLVLPDDIAGSYDLLLWLSDSGMKDATLSLMSQYAPKHRAAEHPPLARTVTAQEYHDVIEYASSLGFTHILAQELGSNEVYFPDFKNDMPFKQ